MKSWKSWNFWSLFWNIFVVLLVRCRASDIFSSVAELESLYRLEQNVIGKLEEYLKNLEQQASVIKRYLEDYNEVRDSENPMGSYVGNPINAFHLMRRLTISWAEVENTFKNNKTQDLAREFMENSSKFPNFDDFSGAAISLAQLQGTYRLNATFLAQGNVQLPGQPLYRSVHVLNARDCLFIGKHAFNKGMYDLSVDWLQTAVTMAHHEGNTTSTVAEIEPFLNTAIRVHDDVLEKKGPVGKDWKTNAEPLNKKRLEKFRKKRVKKSKSPADVQQYEEMEVFYKLCRGEKMRPASVEKDLKCRYGAKQHGYFKLRPLKIEEFSLEPRIVVFHEFVNDGEIAVFKQLATPRLERSAHGGRYGYTTSFKRTSKQAWIDEAHPVVNRLTSRIEAAVHMTAYPTNVASELFQVANYGMGGRYTPHSDYGTLTMKRAENVEIPKEEEFRGDRIATFMAYLHDVEAGGATVFTNANVTIWPEKGAAAFWWNLHSDSSGDEMTRHGACPVLHGSKWISNKWFHFNDQMFLRPCRSEPMQRYSSP